MKVIKAFIVSELIMTNGLGHEHNIPIMLIFNTYHTYYIITIK